MKAYDTYIFDLDGTITDTMTVWLSILRDALMHFGITPPDDKELISYTHDWRELRRIGFPENKFDKFATFIYGLANKRLPEAKFQDNAFETLTALKNSGRNIAIFSTIDRQMFGPVMEHRNLYAITSVAVAGNDVALRKPHPAGIFKALEGLGVEKTAGRNIVYVGDKETDVQTAHNAGIDSILYYPASHHFLYDLSDLEKHNPTHVISDWRELLE
jgi:phosphoglycolate phosphatase